jgi:hypothetical protein
MSILDDNVYWRFMMFAVFLDWLSLETGESVTSAYAERRIAEAFDHYAWLATYKES